MNTERLKVLLFLLLSLFALAGCNEDYIDKVHNEIEFKGEGKKWKATLIEESTEIWGEDDESSITYENTSGTKLFKLTYKEEDFSDVIITKYE